MVAHLENTPVPDPTKLTVEFVHREVLLLRDSLESKILAAEEAAEQQSDYSNEKIEALDQKILRQLIVIESHRIEQKKDTKDAVDAALTAAKEQVREQKIASDLSNAERQANIKEMVTAQSTTVAAEMRGLTATLDDVKNRLTIQESLKQGGSDVKASFYAGAAFLIGIVGLIAFIAGKG